MIFGMFVSVSLCISLYMFIVSNSLLMFKTTSTVGLLYRPEFWLKNSNVPKKLNCPEFWHPVNYFSELIHETCLFDFGMEIEKSETIPSEDFFLGLHPSMLDNFIFSALSKLFLASTPIFVRHSAYSNMTTLFYSALRCGGLELLKPPAILWQMMCKIVCVDINFVKTLFSGVCFVLMYLFVNVIIENNDLWV